MALLDHTRYRIHPPFLKLDSLPSEVLLYILSFLRSQSDLWSCLFVCKRLSLHALEALWAEPFINNEQSFQMWISLLSKTPYILHNVQDTNMTTMDKRSSNTSVSSDIGAFECEKEMEDDAEMDVVDYVLFDHVLIEDQGVNVVPMVNGVWENYRRKSFSSSFESSLSDSATVLDGWKRKTLCAEQRPPSPPPDGFRSLTRNSFPLSKRTVPVVTFGKWIRNLYLDSEKIRNLVNDSIVNRILLSTGSRLKRMDLSGCEILGDRAFEIFKTSRRMSRYSFEMPCKFLEAISLQGCSGISSDALKRLFINTPQLRILNLNRVSSVNDEVLEIIGSTCGNLKGLSLNSCFRVSDYGLECIVKFRRNHSELTELSLCDCTLLTDSSIAAIALSCPDLSYLRLTGCRKVTDKSICEIIENCPQLQYLFLARCSISNPILRKFKQIADQGRISILEYIDLAYASQITFPYLMEMICSCKNLISVGLGACQQIIQNEFVKSLSEPPGNDLPIHIRDSYCVFRGQESISKLKDYYMRFYLVGK